MRKNKEEKKNKSFWSTKVWILLGAVVFLCCLVLLYFYVFTPQIHLKGKKVIDLEYQEKFVDKGYTASYLGKDVTKKVKVSGKVNSKKLGVYTITYRVGSGFFSGQTKRTVRVKDMTKPKMEMDKSDIYVCPGEKVSPLKEVKATDNYDGDLTKKVKHELNKEESILTYYVSDSSGNIKKISKNVLYQDIEKPTLTLNGKETMYAFVGEGFTDPGVVAEDNCDSEIQDKVKVNGSVDINTLGEYNLTYEATDKDGNMGSVSRKVIVRKRGGIIYLTFDDGPNPGTTNIILDILKEEGVKATFFVTGYGPDELIKREYDEGHTVALHTMVHDYSTVYASDEAYFNDLYAIQNRVKAITGEESKIIRFPGGSSNTVSRHYSNGIMSRLTQEVVNRGFKYYDWNISSGDAGNTTLSSVVYSNVVNSLSPTRENMVLMHDVKPYTRDALRDIIRFGKENGYIFERITMDTDMVTQRVNN